MSIDFSFPISEEAKVGDMVRITDPKWFNCGIEGQCAEISKRGIYVKYKDIMEPVFCPCSYEIVKEDK